MESNLSNAILEDIWKENEFKDALSLHGPILIVGGSGFIGANLSFSLLKLRKDVYSTYSRMENNIRLSTIKELDLFHHFLFMDVTDQKSISDIIFKIKPKTIFYFAAYGGYHFQQDPHRIYNVNFLGLLNFLEAIKDYRIEAFIHTGSSSEYGFNSKYSDESFELMPNSHYSISKISATYLIKYYSNVHDLPCMNLRPFSIYGPWEESTRLIPQLIGHGLKQSLPKFGEAQISRDFVYVDDCTHALVKSALKLYQKGQTKGMTINIASGVKTSLGEMAQIVRKKFSIQDPPTFCKANNRPWDQKDWYGNPNLAKLFLNWKAKTTLSKGIDYSIRWNKAFREKFKTVDISIKENIPPYEKKIISIVVACYKDKMSIPIIHQKISEIFQDINYEYELIFVNDNSPYNDEEEIIKLSHKDERILGISHSRNFGSQAAFLSGMEKAQGEAVILMDGDLQDPPEIIPKFINQWEQGNHIVYGIRKKRDAPILMKIFYKLYYRMIKIMSQIEMPLDAGDFSLIDKKAYQQILKLKERDPFLRNLRAWIGFNQIGVKYYRPQRPFGKSTNSFFKNIWWAKKGLYSISDKPITMIQLTAVLFLIITSILITAEIPNALTKKTISPSIIFLLFTIQLLSISIIGDYIIRINKEVRKRPLYIREKIIKNGKIYQDK